MQNHSMVLLLLAHAFALLEKFRTPRLRADDAGHFYNTGARRTPSGVGYL